MSKLGVGVGEEFPVDEQNRPQPEEATQEAGCCGADWRRQRKLRREAWRRFRHQMHSEWHSCCRAMKGRQDGVEILTPADQRERHLTHLVIGALAVVGLAALFSHHHRNR